MKLTKSHASLGNLVVAPYAGSSRGAVCLTCGKLVDHEEIVEGYPGESPTCKVLVRHHGAEELRTFDMGSTNWDHQDLASMMARTNWFNPREHEGLGLGIRVPNVGEHDDKAEGEFNVIVGGGG
ncbi:MAG: hypothetical protein ACRCU1_11530 [Alsobacter sp.]